MDIENRLKKILEHILDEEVDITNHEASLEETYGMDSMDAVEITERIEAEFGIEIETKSIPKMRKVGDLLAAIGELQAESN